MRKQILVLSFVFIVLMSGIAFSDVNVTYQGKPIEFDDNYGYPYIDENWRTMMPLNIVLSTMGVEVTWLPDEYAVDLVRDNISVYVPINKNYVIRNGEVLYNESRTIIKNGRTYLPLRLVLEAFGAEVDWVSESRTVTIEDTDELYNDALRIGANYLSIREHYGLPDRIDESEYGFDWYIYNRNLAELTYIGYDASNIVNGIFTMDDSLNLGLEAGIGDSANEVLSKYEQLDYITKGNTRYSYSNIYGDNVILVEDKGHFVRFFMDSLNDEVMGVMIIDGDVERTFRNYTADGSPELKESYMMQILDMTNCLRYKNQLSILSYDVDITRIAEAHSIDMMENNYFSHVSLNGETLGDRLNSCGIKYRLGSENIASGQQSGIFAVVGWMNSSGHRKNMLTSQLDYIGIGVAFGGTYGVYYTQNFIQAY